MEGSSHGLKGVCGGLLRIGRFGLSLGEGLLQVWYDCGLRRVRVRHLDGLAAVDTKGRIFHKLGTAVSAEAILAHQSLQTCCHGVNR